MFFLSRYSLFSNLYVLLFLLTPCLAVTVQPCMEWIPIKKQKQNKSNTPSPVLIYLSPSPQIFQLPPPPFPNLQNFYFTLQMKTNKIWSQCTNLLSNMTALRRNKKINEIWRNIIRDCQKITFVMLNGFCPLSNPPPPITPVLTGQYQNG